MKKTKYIILNLLELCAVIMLVVLTVVNISSAKSRKEKAPEETPLPDARELIYITLKISIPEDAEINDYNCYRDDYVADQMVRHDAVDYIYDYSYSFTAKITVDEEDMLDLEKQIYEYFREPKIDFVQGVFADEPSVSEKLIDYWCARLEMDRNSIRRVYFRWGTAGGYTTRHIYLFVMKQENRKCVLHINY